MASYIAPNCVKCDGELTMIHLMQFEIGNSIFITAICFPCNKYHTGWTGDDNYVHGLTYRDWKQFTDENSNEIILLSPDIFGTEVPERPD